MALNINGIKLKKCNINGVKCKRINVNGVKVWTAEVAVVNGNITPVKTSDAVITIGDITLTGLEEARNNGLSFNGSEDFTVSGNGVKLQSRSSSGYQNTYTQTNRFQTQYIDISGMSTIRLAGTIGIGVGGWGTAKAILRLRDSSGNAVDLGNQEYSIAQTNGSTSLSIEKSISSVSVNLSNVRIEVVLYFSHYAPWSNWYGGSSYIIVNTLMVE